GKVTMLWAGESHDRTVKYGQIADQIAKNDDPNIRTLNKTVANRVLADRSFMELVGGIGRINGILFSNWKFGLPPLGKMRPDGYFY
ncbi:MAG: hypothetical protein KBD76_16190, partial [Bacteriovorax sp.]|nr:hypothetical protein [Bacteriovorax sp.]